MRWRANGRQRDETMPGQLAATDYNGGTESSSQSSSDSGQTANEPEYIYIEYRNEEGNWEQQYRIEYSDAKALLTDAGQDVHSEQVEIVQGIATHNSEFQVLVTAFNIVIVFAIFMAVGSIAVSTLMRSLEVR